MRMLWSQAIIRHSVFGVMKMKFDKKSSREFHRFTKHVDRNTKAEKEEQLVCALCSYRQKSRTQSQMKVNEGALRTIWWSVAAACLLPLSIIKHRLNTCSNIELILSTSQSMRKRFSCRRSISSMMRRYSMGSTMFPTERAVTCQLLATADSMMAWRIKKPAGEEGEQLHHIPECPPWCKRCTL